jgi:hypothetical protein
MNEHTWEITQYLKNALEKVQFLISKQAQGYKTWENKLYNNGKFTLLKVWPHLFFKTYN